MLIHNNNKGYAIALAWPETFCKQAGAWYDLLMKKIGLSINNHYKVGHAAVVLINGQNGKCHYFDFGRYHAPFGHGRVRNEESDHDVAIKTTAVISPSNTIDNLNEILHEIYHNPACHGKGPIHASLCNLQFERAYRRAKAMQGKNPWKYGPFAWNGTNCSRFVRTVILSGIPSLKQYLRLGLPLSVSPTPIGNVRSIGQKMVFPTALYENKKNEAIGFGKPPDIVDLMRTLTKPRRPIHLPEKAQWLSGEGAGSWFHIEKYNNLFKVYRYNPDGKIECSGLFFNLGKQNLDLKISYNFTHLSHCDQVKIQQKGKVIPLKKTNTN